MEIINKTTRTVGQRTYETYEVKVADDGTSVKVEFTPNRINGEVKPNDKGYIGMADVDFGGHFGIKVTHIAVYTNNEGEPRILMPSRVRMRNGEAVTDENGRKIYDDIVFPIAKGGRKDLVEAIAIVANEYLG